MTRKKRIEIRYTEDARRACRIFPAGDLIPHEKPDFVIHHDTGSVGIEVTELCREEPRAEAARLAKVPEKAKVLYSQLAGAEPVDVALAFSRNAATISLGALTKALVDFVYKRGDRDGANPRANLPEGYIYIGIHTPHEQSNQTGRWQAVRAGDTVIAPKQLIESRIREKNARLIDYRLTTSQIWLLIVNDQFLGPGEVYVSPDNLRDWTFRFDFEKVLLFSRQPGGDGDVFELHRTSDPA